MIVVLSKMLSTSCLIYQICNKAVISKPVNNQKITDKENEIKLEDDEEYEFELENDEELDFEFESYEENEIKLEDDEEYEFQLENGEEKEIEKLKTINIDYNCMKGVSLDMFFLSKFLNSAIKNSLANEIINKEGIDYDINSEDFDHLKKIKLRMNKIYKSKKNLIIKSKRMKEDFIKFIEMILIKGFEFYRLVDIVDDTKKKVEMLNKIKDIDNKKFIENLIIQYEGNLTKIKLKLNHLKEIYKKSVNYLFICFPRIIKIFEKYNKTKKYISFIKGNLNIIEVNDKSNLEKKSNISKSIENLYTYIKHLNSDSDDSDDLENPKDLNECDNLEVLKQKINEIINYSELDQNLKDLEECNKSEVSKLNINEKSNQSKLIQDFYKQKNLENTEKIMFLLHKLNEIFNNPDFTNFNSSDRLNIILGKINELRHQLNFELENYEKSKNKIDDIDSIKNQNNFKILIYVNNNEFNDEAIDNSNNDDFTKKEDSVKDIKKANNKKYGKANNKKYGKANNKKCGKANNITKNDNKNDSIEKASDNDIICRICRNNITSKVYYINIGFIDFNFEITSKEISNSIICTDCTYKHFSELQSNVIIELPTNDNTEGAWGNDNTELPTNDNTEGAWGNNNTEWSNYSTEEAWNNDIIELPTNDNTEGAWGNNNTEWSNYSTEEAWNNDIIELPSNNNTEGVWGNNNTEWSNYNTEEAWNNDSTEEALSNDSTEEALSNDSTEEAWSNDSTEEAWSNDNIDFNLDFLNKDIISENIKVKNESFIKLITRFEYKLNLIKTINSKKLNDLDKKIKDSDKAIENKNNLIKNLFEDHYKNIIINNKDLNKNYIDNLKNSLKEIIKKNDKKDSTTIKYLDNILKNDKFFKIFKNKFKIDLEFYNNNLNELINYDISILKNNTKNIDFLIKTVLIFEKIGYEIIKSAKKKQILLLKDNNIFYSEIFNRNNLNLKDEHKFHTDNKKLTLEESIDSLKNIYIDQIIKNTLFNSPKFEKGINSVFLVQYFANSIIDLSAIYANKLYFV